MHAVVSCSALGGPLLSMRLHAASNKIASEPLTPVELSAPRNPRAEPRALVPELSPLEEPLPSKIVWRRYWLDFRWRRLRSARAARKRWRSSSFCSGVAAAGVEFFRFVYFLLMRAAR